MNDDIQNVVDDVCCDAREDSIHMMLRDFYNRRMLSTVVLVLSLSLLFMAGAVFSAVRFFAATEVKNQILYATLFICLMHFVGLLKVFAWQVVHRNGIKREIKRLEIRIAGLAKSLDK